MKKIKIFLGAYLNYTNAQNLNCLALAKHLDKNKFDVYALTTHFGVKNINVPIHLFNCFKPIKFSRILGFIWGVIKCDILYLPKHDLIPIWLLKFARLYNRKIFTTIEINMCDTDKENMISNFGGVDNLKKHFNLIHKVYGISEFLVKNSNCGVKLEKEPLYLGVDDTFIKKPNILSLSNIVFVGSLIRRKNLDEIIELAVLFKKLKFHIIGDGILRKELESKATSNVLFYGKLTHEEISRILSNMDLNILLSRSEGFPKVILETAAAGIPSLVYNDYGADEWITNNKNGFVLSKKEDVIKKLQELILKPELLTLNSKETTKLANEFSWKVKVKGWENEILKL